MNGKEIHEILCARMGDSVVGPMQEHLSEAIQVAPDAVHSVCSFLRDDDRLRFDFLRAVTGVDRKDAIEVVYHLYSYPRRHEIAIKVKLDRDKPSVSSVCDVWPTANWHERETFDLLGVRFDGHPSLKRLLMPEDWQGYPLRKDYERPATYHGISTTRGPALPMSRVELAKDERIKAWHEPKREEVAGVMQLNMGPHHPATHGVINFLLETDGEILQRATPDVGYLHRGIEKLSEGMPYIGTMPYTDRIEYLGSMFANHAWALTVERLSGIAVPPRAEYCRVIASELNRIGSHLIGTGALAMDIGAVTPFVHWLREREKINDIMERICGARLTYNYFRFGGVAHDIDVDTVKMILDWANHFEPIIDEFNRLISDNEIFVRRLANMLVISPDEAVGYGLVGPNLRGSGVDWDLRKDLAYSAYPEIEFEVVVGKGWRGTVGDAYDRYYCRVLEMRESLKIIRQACERLPAGESWIRPKTVKPAANEVYACVESGRGELGAYTVSDGTDKPYRSRFRTGSFTAMSIIEHMSPGILVADLVALIGSLDILAPEVDR
jgi:NADH-quinone oxidoreductase subunit D